MLIADLGLFFWKPPFPYLVIIMVSHWSSIVFRLFGIPWFPFQFPFFSSRWNLKELALFLSWMHFERLRDGRSHIIYTNVWIFKGFVCCDLGGNNIWMIINELKLCLSVKTSELNEEGQDEVFKACHGGFNWRRLGSLQYPFLHREGKHPIPGPGFLSTLPWRCSVHQSPPCHNIFPFRNSLRRQKEGCLSSNAD